MRRLFRTCRAAGLLVLAGLAGGGALEALPAQARPGGGESELLRDAATRESQGDLAGAERVLRELLAARPTSSGGLFALERVLRAQGRTADVLPLAEAFLARDPEASGIRYLELRVLMEVDSLDALRAETERWIERDPTAELPYREAARVHRRAFGEAEALALLLRGREATGRPDALALEVGDLHAATGDLDAAAREWALALDGSGSRMGAVAGRIRDLPSGGDEAGRAVVANLAGSPDAGRRRAGVRLALDLGLEADALALAEEVAGSLGGRERDAFLNDVARRAREADLVRVASWAYDQLGEGARSAGDRRQVDLRMVELALASGDTAAALEAQNRVVRSYSPGSADRRRATARAIRLESASADPDRLRVLLASFRREFPGAPEVDALASGVAARLLARGDREGATLVLEGVDGPRSSLERGWLLLEAGRLEEGRQSLLLAVTGLPPAEATPVIQLAGLLGRLSPQGAAALAEAGVAAHGGDALGAAQRLASAAEGAPEADRPALLAEAARMADRGGDRALGASLRETLISAHPEAPEVGEASLALARHHASTAAGVPEAIRILEELITSRPNAAVVPDARMELERLRRRGQ